MRIANKLKGMPGFLIFPSFALQGGDPEQYQGRLGVGLLRQGGDRRFLWPGGEPRAAPVGGGGLAEAGGDCRMA